MPDFARDSLSNLAASLNAGKDKAAADAFFVYDLGRGQIEAMYRGDWLARKIVDIVPYDMVREWRAWSGDRAAVKVAEAAERRLNLRKVVQRALTLGRLYGGAAIIVGTGAERPDELARELDPETIRPGELRFLHVVSRWQLASPTVNRDPLDPWFGEPDFYEVVAPTRGALRLHPSRVLRFLGHELPDPSLGVSVWSDSILQVLYDAIHAVALTTTGATSLMHEAKVDVVTVPNLSEHLSSAATTAQLSARFAYAAAMKSINNLLLLGDGESWARQRIDFGGVPEMVRTFLQVAAGAADIPVTRLLGQSPAGLSATGESDTRNYYDMIAARQAIDLRPHLERLDALMLRSAGLDPAALSFGFRPLWQMDAAAAAGVALQKAQATQVYAGLGLWPAETTARLVRSQLIEDATYPGAEAIFASASARPAADFSPDQPRDPDGRWSAGGAAPTSTLSISGTDPAGSLGGEAAPISPTSSALASPRRQTGLGGIVGLLNPIGKALAQEIEGEENRGLAPESSDPTAEILIERYINARSALRSIEPSSPELVVASRPDYEPSESEVQRLEAAARAAATRASSLVPSSPPVEPEPPVSWEPIKSLELTIKIDGSTSNERSKSFEEQVRSSLDFDKVDFSWQKGARNPDGVLGDRALEVKYVDKYPSSIYSPESLLRFRHDEIDGTIQQARDYAESYPGGLTFASNNLPFLETYRTLFWYAGVIKVNFIHIVTK